MNRKTQAPDAPIRLPLRHDAKPIRELARLAHPRMPDHMVNELGTVMHNGYMDGTRMAFQETANAAIIDNVPFLSSVRVIAPSEQGARSFVFCAPPMNWIVQQRRSGLTIADRVVLSGALTECNLIATQPRWQRRGYATRLLADAEDRYRTAGYRCMFAVLNDGGGCDQVADWYRSRGYTIGGPDTQPMIQFWGDRMHETGRYDHLLGGQRTAFKALHPEVSVTLLRNTVHVRDLLEKQGACP